MKELLDNYPEELMDLRDLVLCYADFQSKCYSTQLPGTAISADDKRRLVALRREIKNSFKRFDIEYDVTNLYWMGDTRYKRHVSVETELDAPAFWLQVDR